MTFPSLTAPMKREEGKSLKRYNGHSKEIKGVLDNGQGYRNDLD